jgi:hypothetical protein
MPTSHSNGMFLKMLNEKLLGKAVNNPESGPARSWAYMFNNF